MQTSLSQAPETQPELRALHPLKPQTAPVWDMTTTTTLRFISGLGFRVSCLVKKTRVISNNDTVKQKFLISKHEAVALRGARNRPAVAKTTTSTLMNKSCFFCCLSCVLGGYRKEHAYIDKQKGVYI